MADFTRSDPIGYIHHPMTAPAEWLHHLEDEADAAFLYRVLTGLEPDARRAEIYRKLASVEDRHVALWMKLLAGLRHLVMDIGAGFELRTNRNWAVLIMILSVLLTAATWAAIVVWKLPA